MMGVIWVTMLCSALIFSGIGGNISALTPALFDGARAALGLCLELGGAMCLWCAVMELMRDCGLLEQLSRVLSPLLCLLLPEAMSRRELRESICANAAANMLGLGNAATPMGISAAKGMHQPGREGEASDELCRFVVLNTASIQLIPTTAAALRESAGAAAPFDILPAVWLSSCASVCVGVGAAYLFARLCK